jgi:hypothetical protein
MVASSGVFNDDDTAGALGIAANPARAAPPARRGESILNSAEFNTYNAPDVSAFASGRKYL